MTPVWEVRDMGGRKDLVLTLTDGDGMVVKSKTRHDWNCYYSSNLRGDGDLWEAVFWWLLPAAESDGWPVQCRMF